MSNMSKALAPFSLEGKVALITGAASGLGKATAGLFLDVGASVIIADLDAVSAKEAADELSARGLTFAVTCDVSNQSSVEAAFAAAAQHFGGIDVLVNNAAYRKKSATMEMTVEDWDIMHAVICRGTFLCTREAAKQMRERGGGAIVNISTMSVAHPVIMQNMNYDSAKAGVEAMTRHSALEFATDNIRVNSVAPGAMLTPGAVNMRNAESSGGTVMSGPALMPGRYLLGRKADPIEMARAILFLASDASSYITGTGILVDAGFSIS
jgi:NAD(P)-dependent dehydrogenase (short-subunit alcohol dehydrogenase family)